jgi:60 kDa SS-A/Ro ribonucleoprotein
MDQSHAAKQAFLETFPQVVRTGSHFYEWLSYTKSMRGFGKVIREAGQTWLSRQDVKGLAYQLLKYQQRQGFSHRDALRLFHVKPVSEEHQALFQWVVNGWEQLPKRVAADHPLWQIWWYEWLKRNPKQSHEAIKQGRLTHEMAAPVCHMDQRAWQLLFNDMPIGALLRNLGSLTQLGMLRVDAVDNLAHVANVQSRCHLLLDGLRILGGSSPPQSGASRVSGKGEPQCQSRVRHPGS